MSDHVRLGVLPEAGAERDAIHVAILPLEAAEKLFPGQDVCVKDGKAASGGDPIGIVDPFVAKPVHPGQLVYVCLYPDTVTGMRHYWEHPGIDAKPIETAAAVIWLKDFAERVAMTYDDMIAHVLSGGWITQQGSDEWQCAYFSDESFFWECIEAVTGKRFPERDRTAPWACSC